MCAEGITYGFARSQGALAMVWLLVAPSSGNCLIYYRQTSCQPTVDAVTVDAVTATIILKMWDQLEWILLFSFAIFSQFYLGKTNVRWFYSGFVSVVLITKLSLWTTHKLCIIFKPNVLLKPTVLIKLQKEWSGFVCYIYFAFYLFFRFRWTVHFGRFFFCCLSAFTYVKTFIYTPSSSRHRFLFTRISKTSSCLYFWQPQFPLLSCHTQREREREILH